MAFDSQTWAAAVRSVLDSHRSTIRGQRLRTGISHSTVVTWLQGVQPRMEAAIAFARGFGLDVNEWLALAGYDPLPTINPRDYWWQSFGALVEACEERGVPPPDRPSFHGGTEALTLAAVDAAIEDLLVDLAADYPDQIAAIRAELER